MGSRSGVHFRCSNCGIELHADVNGAVNIATVGAAFVTRPEYSPLNCPLPQWEAEAAG
ncbi:MAG: transposase [Gammaproteobacteria bacterium]|nr:transposase [Gammaproteobacteria bacterium]MBU2685896.1 transposase [Gammaproteobacteria bacterium]